MKKTIITMLLITPFLLYAEQDSKKSLIESLMKPKFSLESAYMQRANIKDSEGSVQVTKNKMQINNSLISFSYTNWRFDWDKVSELPFGDGVHHPVEEMHGFNLGFKKSYRINERLFSLSSLSFNSTFEDDPKNSLSVGLFSFASYAIDRDHTVQMGLFGSYHPVTSRLFPIISYSYRANHKEGMQVILGFPQTHIGYHVNRDTLVRLGVVFSNSLIRLSDNSSVEPEGFNEFQDYMCNLGVSYDLNSKVKLKADLLYAIKRDFTTYDKDGSKVDSYEIDPTAGAMFKIILEL
nr:hypothetical protein [uncultured Sulfurimonas sp.]